METNKSLQDFIDEFIVEGIKPIVDKKPYLAFILLSSAIEFLGKCLNKTNDWQQNGKSREDFCNAIKTFSSLQKYDVAFANENERNQCDLKERCLYRVLRCAMVHALQPRPEIILEADRNNLAKNTIGCKELYEDVVKACEDVKNMSLNKTIPMYIDGNKTGVTSTTTIEIHPPTDK